MINNSIDNSLHSDTDSFDQQQIENTQISSNYQNVDKLVSMDESHTNIILEQTQPPKAYRKKSLKIVKHLKNAGLQLDTEETV